MRKRLGILILIFSLLLFFPTNKTKGQDLGYFIAELLGVFFSSITIRECKNCDLCYHPGDYFYEKNYKIIKPINKKIIECDENCMAKMDKSGAMGSVRSSGSKSMSYSECYNPCVIEAAKPFPTSMATCKYEGVKGHYNDGSYYDTKLHPDYNHLITLLKNRHKLKDKYEKTVWQKARDECMSITSEQSNMFELAGPQEERLIGLYNDCLKERGY